jgi:hypothetical membrane protein
MLRPPVERAEGLGERAVTQKVNRWSGVLGIAAALSYVVITIVGGVLDPTYSHLRQHVSDLTASGAPTRGVLAPLYVAYNLLVVGFAVGMYLASDRSRWQRAGLALLLVNALAGVMMVTPFPEDLGGAPTTWAGKGHVAFAALASLVIVLSSFTFGAAFRRSAGWRRLATFSTAVGAAFLILGPLAAVATAHRTLAGLAERGPVGLFMLWLLVVGAHQLGPGQPGEPG